MEKSRSRSVRQSQCLCSQLRQVTLSATVPFRLFKTPPNFGGPVSEIGQDQEAESNHKETPDERHPLRPSYCRLIHGVGGSSRGRHLADMGAEVIKVEDASALTGGGVGRPPRRMMIMEQKVALPLRQSQQTRHYSRLGKGEAENFFHPSEIGCDQFLVGTLKNSISPTKRFVRPTNKSSCYLCQPWKWWSLGRVSGLWFNDEHSSGLPRKWLPDDPPTMRTLHWASIAGLNGVAVMLTALEHRMDRHTFRMNLPNAFPLAIHGILQAAKATRLTDMKLTQIMRLPYPCSE